MAAVSDDEVVRGPTPAPLGTLLVSRGLISQEQLADALAEQGEAGGPLGAILVRQGFVRPAVIAQALATQHGGILKTEYGYATGFDARLSEAPSAKPPVSPAPTGLSAALRLAPAGSMTVEAQPGPDAFSPTAPEEEAGSALRAPQLAGLELELAAATGENEKLRSRLGQLQLEAAVMRAESEAFRREAVVVGARVAGLEAAVTALQAEKAHTRAQGDQLDQALARYAVSG